MDKIGNENKESPTYKDIIMSRYCGEFLQADHHTATIRKTSQDIMLDLRPMADFSTAEIAKYLVGLGYSIGFEDATPVWLMTRNTAKEIENQ
jgi:hypothetical protein